MSLDHECYCILQGYAPSLSQKGVPYDKCNPLLCEREEVYVRLYLLSENFCGPHLGDR